MVKSDYFDHIKYKKEVNSLLSKIKAPKIVISNVNNQKREEEAPRPQDMKSKLRKLYKDQVIQSYSLRSKQVEDIQIKERF